AFRAQSPNLRFAPLMDMDFTVSCPLVRHWRLISGFCPSIRTFAPRFLQTSPRGDSPCVIASPSPPSGCTEDSHLLAAEHAQHTTKARVAGPKQKTSQKGGKTMKVKTHVRGGGGGLANSKWPERKL